jgi:uncharacterized membrane protein YeiH
MTWEILNFIGGENRIVCHCLGCGYIGSNARSKPLIFRSEIYAIWAMAGGVIIGLGGVTQSWEMYMLCLFIVIFRLVSVRYKWKLPQGRVS